MKRVLVIGAPGTGKTTFSLKLAMRTELPLVHLDYFYHDKTKDYYEESNKAAWRDKVEELINQDAWIIDGNYNSTLELRVKRADTIFFFDFPRRKALVGILKRRLILRNKKRSDMPGDWKEHIEPGFVRYVWKYNKEKRPKVRKIIFGPKDKIVVVFTNHGEVTRFVNNL